MLMKEVTKRAKILGLSTLENALMQGLSNEPISVSRLSKRLHVPRTSIYRPLKALAARGFVESVRVGKRTCWRRISDELLIAAMSPILFESTRNPGDPPTHPEFFLHTGNESLMRLYEKLGDSKGQRVLGIQPNRSAASVLEVFPFDRLVKLNQRIKDNGVIVEALLQEDFIPFYIDLVNRKGLSVKKILKAFGGRAADTMYVPRQFINFDSEIIILPSSAYIFHWSKGVAIEVRNQETLGLLRDLFALAKSIGHKADQNEMVQEYLKSTK
jgi:hypothetical protein